MKYHSPAVIPSELLKNVDGVIDAQTYQRKLQELNLSQVEMSNKQENHLSEEKQKQQIAQFLELSKSLAQTYQIASVAEKRQLLNLCFSNMTVIDKKVEIARNNWLQRVVLEPFVLDGAPAGIRTPNDGSEDRCDIHFTTGAYSLFLSRSCAGP